MRKEEKKKQSLRAKFYQVSSFYHSVMEVNMREDSESRRLRLFFSKLMNIQTVVKI